MDGYTSQMINIIARAKTLIGHKFMTDEVDGVEIMYIPDADRPDVKILHGIGTSKFKVIVNYSPTQHRKFFCDSDGVGMILNSWAVTDYKRRHDEKLEAMKNACQSDNVYT